MLHPNTFLMMLTPICPKKVEFYLVCNAIKLLFILQHLLAP